MANFIPNLKMADNNDTLWNREQFAQGRVRALVRAMEDFERRDRGRGLGPPPFSVDHLGGPIIPERERPGGVPASRCRGQSRTTTILPPMSSFPLEDHPLMMPKRRYQEDPLLLPTPQPHPQQPQEYHPHPDIPNMTQMVPHYNDLYPPGQTIFCFWCGHLNPIPKYYPPPPYSHRSPPCSESGDSDVIPPYPGSGYESDWDLQDTPLTPTPFNV